MNYVALLAVLAATSFALPLLVQGFEAVGLGRDVSAAVSLGLAGLCLAVWLTRVWRGARGRRAGAASRRGRRGYQRGFVRSTGEGRGRRRAAGGGGRGAVSSGSSGGLGSGSLVEGGPLRLRDAEEENRAGV